MIERIILGDWGTSSCRLHLLEHGHIRDGVNGPGIVHTDNPRQTYETLVSRWEGLHGPLPALLCGTVGANLGWVDAGYVSVPARITDFHERRVRTEREGVAILPGIMTDANAYGRPDVMRSEEMQVFGYLAQTHTTDAHLCLPGSHSKWAKVKNSAITNFTSAATGEVFAAIRAQTLIAPTRDDGVGSPKLSTAFQDGVDLAFENTNLLAAIFSIRADAALNRLSLADSRDRLSGLLIGSECNHMLQLGPPPNAIVGAPGISTAYQGALARLGHTIPTHDGQDAVLAGLRQAAGL